MAKFYPSERCFHFACNVCISKLQELSDHDLRAVLPSLVRMSQCPSLDESQHWQEARKEIQKLLCGLEVVNSIVGLLSVDFGCLRYNTFYIYILKEFIVYVLIYKIILTQINTIL